MQVSDIPYKFSVPWAADAASGYITDPIPATAGGGNASQQLGFPPITSFQPASGGIPPNINDFNGAYFYMTSWLRWFQAGAPVFYDATFSSNVGGYPKGTQLLAANYANFWLSTVDNNTSDPDTGGANWLNVPFLSGFPIAIPSVSSSGSLTASRNGSFVQVVVSSTTQTIASSGWVAGNTIGISARFACTLTLGSGTFQGGALTGTNSVAMPHNTWICLQYDGTNWAIFSASPGYYTKVATAGTQWVRYNSDGTIEQGGVINAPGDSSQHIYALNLAFPNNFFGIDISYEGSTPPSSGAIGANVDNLANFIATNTAPGGSNNCYWRAIGNDWR